MSILDKMTWIDTDKLIAFILSAQVCRRLSFPFFCLITSVDPDASLCLTQDPDAGGIADRPGNVADVFHTLFGLAGLSLLGFPGLVDIDPVYCMPASVIEARGLRKGWKALPRRES